MTLEMILHRLYLATGDEKSDANLCKSIRKNVSLPVVTEVNGSGKH